MKINALIIILLTIFLQLQAQLVYHSASSREQLFDSNWKFLKEDAKDAEDPGFDDANWRTLDLPHDWSIEDLPNQNGESIIGPFSKESIAQGNTGFFIGGIGWYRKHFTISPDKSGKVVSMLFDGVYMNCDVWINGHFLGNHPYGYTPFYYDLTPYINPGKDNVLAVKVRNEGKNSRWYSGSGIYRHVWLKTSGALHIKQWGVYITTPEITQERSKINIQTDIENPELLKEAYLEIKIISPEGIEIKNLKEQISLNKHSVNVSKTIIIEKPMLWSVETPNLYKAFINTYSNGHITDSQIQTFGIRSIKVNAQSGLTLNGKKILLKGGCIHHDNGPLGSATFNRAEERKIEILKNNGFNAIRTSHNPPSEQFLDACDRLGMLVIDEAFDTWQYPKNNDDYHRYFKDWWSKDLESYILRDRNHPSVIFWSIGNEIFERADSSGVEIATQMIKKIKTIDSTRQITEGVNGFWDHPGRDWDFSKHAFEILDVAGCNYQWKNYESDHLKFPQRIMAGTESLAYEAAENWNLVKKVPYVIGDFVWTAMDYMGEAGLAHNDQDSLKNWKTSWPWYTANCGDIDICGFKRPQSYYRDVIWDRSIIEMAVHNPSKENSKEVFTYWGWPDVVRSWNWAGNENKLFKVYVFSKSEKVRLELNHRVIDEKSATDSAKHTFIFDVPYMSGELKAIALTDGKEYGLTSIKTTGVPYALQLTADRPKIQNDPNELIYVSVEITDNEGNIVPNANIPVEFSMNGTGELAATGNGNPVEMASFKQLKRNTFRGRCLAILRPTNNGIITFSASSNGLRPATIKIEVK